MRDDRGVSDTTAVSSAAPSRRLTAKQGLAAAAALLLVGVSALVWLTVREPAALADPVPDPAAG